MILLLSIHIAILNLKANKNDDGTWEIEHRNKKTNMILRILKDSKRLYRFNKSSVPMPSLFSSTLNNFAAISRLLIIRTKPFGI